MSPTARRYRLEFGAFRPPLVRQERIELNVSRPVRLLYASDLHLGRRWTRAVPGQLVRAVREAAPDLILLGGDLADNRRGLPALRGPAPALLRHRIERVPGDPAAPAALLPLR